MYIESFDKTLYSKSIIYFFIFLFLQLFGGNLLSIIGCDIISNNITFFVYGLLFVFSIILFGTKILFPGLKKFDKSYFNTFAVIGIITFFAIIFSGIAIDLMGISNSNENEIDTALTSNYINYALTAVVAIIFAPISEEIFFRFVVYRSLEKINPILSHICVALLFGFFHIWNYVLIQCDYIQLINMIPYICMSLGFSILYQKAKNIWYPIILHGIINFIAVAL